MRAAKGYSNRESAQIDRFVSDFKADKRCERGMVRLELAARLVEADGALDMSGYLMMSDSQLAETAQLCGVV